MPHIEYLGFVLEHNTRDADAVVVACVAKLQEGGRSVWKVYPAGKQAFILMLFVTSVRIKQKLAEKGAPPGENLLHKPDPKYDFVLNHLFDVRTKRKSYTSLPDDLRQAIRHFFVLYGQKDTIRLQAPQGGLRSEQMFFWTRRDFMQKTNQQQLPNTPTQITVEEDPPLSNPNIMLLVPDIAEMVRLSLAQPQSWQELYKKAIWAPKNLPANLIPLYGSRVDLPEKTQGQDERIQGQVSFHREQHLKLSDALACDSRILVTGPPGSGKTTILKMLMKNLLGTDSPIAGLLPIFISLKYVGFNGKTVIDLIVDSVVSCILGAESLKKTMLQQIDVRRAHYGDTLSPGLPIDSAAKHDQTAKSIFVSEVRDFFISEEAKDGEPIALLLDGYNEIAETGAYKAGEEIERLSKRVTKIIVSSRSYGAPRILSCFARFELEQLSSEQIIQYLNPYFDFKGDAFFKRHIQANYRLLSMARVPFYLELMVQYLQKYPDRSLPATPGALLEFFVREQYENDEKKSVMAERFPKVSESRINLLLTQVARSLAKKGRERAGRAIPFPELPDILPAFSIQELEETARAAELLGFLEKSGQISEQVGESGIVTFAHDNIRDFFAALHLKSLTPNKLAEYLPEMAEYFDWDQPLLFFLELTTDKILSKKIIEFFLPFDPIMAGACARHAQVVDKVFLLSVVKQISQSPFGQGVDMSPRARAQSTICSDVDWPSTYALGRLSISQLIEIALDPSQDSEVRECARGAIPGNSGPDDLPALKEFWVKLYKTPDMELGVPLFAVRNIPTAEAFDFQIEAYAQLRKLPGYGQLSGNHIFHYLAFGPSSLGFGAYSPSFAEVAAKFPPEKYPDECSALLGRVGNVTSKEISLVEEIMFSDNLELARAASSLLARTLGEQALPTLLRLYSSLEEGKKKEGKSAGSDAVRLRETLLEIFVELSPRQAAPILIAERNKQPAGPWPTLGFWEIQPTTLLRLLAKTRAPEALEYITKKACADWLWDREAAAFYATLLEAWPDRASAIRAVEDFCHEGELGTQMPILLATRLGAQQYIRDAEAIFNDVFDRAILDSHPPPAHPIVLEVLFENNLKYWNLSDQRNALYMLPAALRAVTEVPNPQIAEKVLQIITWGADELLTAEHDGPDRDESIRESLIRDFGTFTKYVVKSLAEAIYALIKLIPTYYSEQKLEAFLTPDFLKKLFHLVEDPDAVHWFQIRSELGTVLLDLCKATPGNYVGLLFSVARQYFESHLDLFTRRSPGNIIDCTWLFDVLVCLCQQISDSDVRDFLQFLDIASKQSDDIESHRVLASLIQVIKYARGRRFISTVA